MNGKFVFGSSPKVQLRRLLWVGPLTILASILGVLIVRVIAVAILQPDPTPISLGWVVPVISTFVLVTGAAAGVSNFRLGRFDRRALGDGRARRGLH